MTTSLILIAHGSRSARSNDEVRALAARLAELGSADRVAPAFLELAEPSLAETVTQEVAAGAARILVLPYFLNSGRHVTRDVPALVEAAQAEHPDADIELMQHIGGTRAFLTAVETIVREQVKAR